MLRTAALLLLLLLVGPAPALARGGGQDDAGGRGARHGGGREARRTASCGAGARAELRLSQDDGAIAVAWRLERHRGGERWRVSLVRNGRVLARGVARTGGGSGSFSYRRRISDLPGADCVTARAVGPGGRSCSATATLASR